MTADQEQPPKSNLPEHERLEVEMLADAVLSAFELADTIEVHDLAPTMQRITLDVDADSLPMGFESGILPQELYALIGEDDTALRLTYESASLGERPSLELQLLRAPSGDVFIPFATLHRSGNSTNLDPDLTGTAISPVDDKEYSFTTSAEAIALLLQQLIKPEGFVINEHGVTLLQELIHDPQYPPVARFISDVLEERGSLTTREESYPLTISGVDFVVRTTTDEGKTSEITIVEVFHDSLEVLGNDFKREYKAVGASISRTQFSQAIKFFEVNESGDEAPFKADGGDLLRLKEQIAHLRQHITAAEL